MTANDTRTPDLGDVQPRKPLRKRTWFRVTLGGGAGLVALIAVGAALSGQQATVTPSAAAPPAATAPATPVGQAAPSTPAAAPATGTQNLTAGQSVHVTEPDMGYAGTVTVLSVRTTTAPYDASYGRAPANGRYVIAKVTMTADHGRQLDASSLDFYARTADGQHYNEGGGNSYDAFDSSTDLSSTTLNSGEKVTGYLVFDIPAAGPAVIAYSPALGNGSTIATWAI